MKACEVSFLNRSSSQLNLFLFLRRLIFDHLIMRHSTYSYLQVYTILIVVLVFSQMSPTQGTCVEDWECGVGYYCLESNHCETCIPCETVFNRQSIKYSTGEIACAKSVVNCGACLKGFQPFNRTDLQFSQKCFPADKSVSYSATSAAATATQTKFLVVVLAGCLGWIVN